MASKEIIGVSVAVNKNSSNELVVVLVTAPGKECAGKLASTLLEKRLAACVNITPNIISMYHWKGKIEHDIETLLIIKTISSRFSELKETIVSHHPYDTPEVIMLESGAVFEKYLSWVVKETETTE